MENCKAFSLPKLPLLTALCLTAIDTDSTKYKKRKSNRSSREKMLWLKGKGLSRDLRSSTQFQSSWMEWKTEKAFFTSKAAAADPAMSNCLSV
ncbi:hypothetical protein CEXT_200541 [Caerostris extrusa]|uniref:Secreted protein n=1 Tax=Caerostris extrusa TaxID=172846 RepID=A0AAV4MUI0_CAEEX|nr:hypothetical protein CEXT_200541 [Caerostris extrusa]